MDPQKFDTTYFIFLWIHKIPFTHMLSFSGSTKKRIDSSVFCEDQNDNSTNYCPTFDHDAFGISLAAGLAVLHGNDNSVGMVSTYGYEVGENGRFTGIWIFSRNGFEMVSMWFSFTINSSPNSD